MFINKNGNRLGIRGVEDICRKAYKLIGIEEDGYSVHTLTHTDATIMYKHKKHPSGCFFHGSLRRPIFHDEKEEL